MDVKIFEKKLVKNVKKSDIEKQYQVLPSISDYLPWLEFSDEKNLVLLEDGRSVGALYEIKSVPTEARPEEQIISLHEKITRLLTTLLPLENDNPWVMQIFVQDDLTLQPIYKALEKYIEKHDQADDPFAQKYLEIMQDHFKKLTSSDGIFVDPMSDLKFRGKIRRIRICIYRRYNSVDKKFNTNVVDEIESICQKFETQIRQIGIRIKRLNGEHFYDWLVRWFNPSPSATKGDIDSLLQKYPYPNNEKPYGWSPSQNIFFGNVESYDNGWIFDGIKHKVMVFKDLDGLIPIGAISREMSMGQTQKYAIFDKFPPGAIYTIQMTFESKQAVNVHLDGIESAAIGKSTVIKDIHDNISRARYEMDVGNLLLRCVEAIYFCADNDVELNKIENNLKSALDVVQLKVTNTQQEIFPKDLYLRFLPFNFNYEFDKRENFRSSYKYSSDVAKLIPLYGRSQGDGQNPLHIYYNRGGEVFMFDELSPEFKMANSHMAIVGTTGSGKSVTLNNMILTLAAVRNPRIIAMEVGGSFDLSSQYLEKYGKNVKVIKFDRLNPIAINPYSEAYRALEIIEMEEAAVLSAQNSSAIEEIVSDERSEKLLKELHSVNADATNAEIECIEDRDILNEMVIATRLMITQGKTREEKKIDPTDLSLITKSLIHAMKTCRKNHVPQMLLTHVIESMNTLSLSSNSDDITDRLKKFATRLEYYKSGIRGQFINTPSEPLTDFDFLHIDFGFMQSESYTDLMNIVCVSLLAKILALAEANKSSGRPTKLFMDEAHVLFKSDLVAAFVILMAKVARKIGLWLTPCTQNIEDFTGIESKKLLSMMETWLCLSLEPDEIDLVSKFKPISEEMRSLILDIRKYQGIYSESVLIGKRFSGLFRNIPPSIALALAMTEQTERAFRKKVQKKLGVSELEAVEYIAGQMRSHKNEISDEKFFFY